MLIQELLRLVLAFYNAFLRSNQIGNKASFTHNIILFQKETLVAKVIFIFHHCIHLLKNCTTFYTFLDYFVICVYWELVTNETVIEV